MTEAHSTINWPRAIERNRVALLRVLAMLVAMLAPGEGGPAACVPRYLRNRVMQLLRPAESAARRLVVALARGLTARPAPGRPLPAGLGARAADASGESAPCFPLFDELMRFSPHPRRRYAKTVPRITCLDLSPLRPWSEPVLPMPDDLVDAAGLCRRFCALQSVLDDLPRAARRMARWTARCAQFRAHEDWRPRRMVALRSGRPPGFCERREHEVDVLLDECHYLALNAPAAPDTS